MEGADGQLVPRAAVGVVAYGVVTTGEGKREPVAGKGRGAERGEEPTRTQSSAPGPTSRAHYKRVCIQP